MTGELSCHYTTYIAATPAEVWQGPHRSRAQRGVVGGTATSRTSGRGRPGNAFPHVTATQNRDTYQLRAYKLDKTPATPGGYLRDLLGDTAPCPARSTLAAGLKAIRQEPPRGSAEPPSG